MVFINEEKTSHLLERIVDSRKLKLISVHNINETFQSDFDFQAYKPMIISPHYIIQSNKLFYLWLYFNNIEKI